MNCLEIARGGYADAINLLGGHPGYAAAITDRLADGDDPEEIAGDYTITVQEVFEVAFWTSRVQIETSR